MSSVFDLATCLAQAQAGHPAAIADLYTAYGVSVQRYCAARLGSAEAAEDCTQEVFLRIWRAVRTFDYRGDVSFTAWLYTIANHVVVSYLRKHRRVALVSLTPELGLADSRTSATAHTICEQVVLRDALAELTVEQQQVITLKFWGACRTWKLLSGWGAARARSRRCNIVPCSAYSACSSMSSVPSPPSRSTPNGNPANGVPSAALNHATHAYQCGPYTWIVVQRGVVNQVGQ